MPTKITKTQKSIEAAAALPPVPKELIDLFCTGPMTGEPVNTATVAFKKALIERALGGELSHHLGYAQGDAKPQEASNHRNGCSGKTVLTGDSPLRIDVPRDRAGSFEPRLIPKHERRFTGFDDRIIAMYARGMTMREIQGFLLDDIAPAFRAARCRRAESRTRSRPEGRRRSASAGRRRCGCSAEHLAQAMGGAEALQPWVQGPAT
jgi:hypothetical protein